MYAVENKLTSLLFVEADNGGDSMDEGENIGGGGAVEGKVSASGPCHGISFIGITSSSPQLF